MVPMPDMYLNYMNVIARTPPRLTPRHALFLIRGHPRPFLLPLPQRNPLRVARQRALHGRRFLRPSPPLPWRMTYARVAIWERILTLWEANRRAIPRCVRKPAASARQTWRSFRPRSAGGTLPRVCATRLRP